jgi:uncharacterized protein YcfL
MTSGAFFFDIKPMNHSTSNNAAALLTVSITSLLMLAGCASSHQRASNESQSGDQLETSSTLDSGTLQQSDSQTDSHVETHTESIAQSNWSYEDQQSSLRNNPYDNELVIGTLYQDKIVPMYSLPTKECTLDEIRIELEAMYELDEQLVRASVDHSADTLALSGSVNHVDRAHTARLKEIIDHIGWPTREQVGLKATQAAYMVIQHAGHDNEFQNQCLTMMVDLVENGELPASYVALLTDRIRAFQNQPQLFGTQMAIAEDEFGSMVPMPTVPIEDPDHLDERRKLMGMPPHSQFVSAIEIAYHASLTEPGNAFAEVPTDE